MQALLVVLLCWTVYSAKDRHRIEPTPQVELRRHPAYLAQQERRNQKAEEIFANDQLGRDKSVQAKAEGTLWFQVSHTGRYDTTQSEFQQRPVKLNEYSCYFMEEDISYRGVIGGFDLDKVFQEGQDDPASASCCHRIGAIVPRSLGHFQGYCFEVRLDYELWTLCHQNQSDLDDFQMHLRAQTLSSYIKKYNIDPPSFESSC